MDDIDRTILTAMQNNARTTAAELAHLTGTSSSTCLRRLRALESEGVIEGYRTRIDPTSLGFSLQIIAFITLEREDRATVAHLEDALTALPEIIAAERLFGDPDFLVRVIAADLASYQRFRDEKLAEIPGVGKITSTLVMRTIVSDRPLPV